MGCQVLLTADSACIVRQIASKFVRYCCCLVRFRPSPPNPTAGALTISEGEGGHQPSHLNLNCAPKCALILVNRSWLLVACYALLVLDSAESACFLTHKTWPRWFEPYLWSQSSEGLEIKDFPLLDTSKTQPLFESIWNPCQPTNAQAFSALLRGNTHGVTTTSLSQRLRLQHSAAFAGSLSKAQTRTLVSHREFDMARSLSGLALRPGRVRRESKIG